MGYNDTTNQEYDRGWTSHYVPGRWFKLVFPEMGTGVDVEDEPLVLGVSSKISDNNTLGYIRGYSYSILHGGSRLGSEV